MKPLFPAVTSTRPIFWLSWIGCCLVTLLSVPGILPVKRNARRKILFLCTGNYYRSRIAEEIFNHLAQQAGLDYVAVSKALAANLDTVGNVGPIAPMAVTSLESFGYPVRSKLRWPETVSALDFENAETVVGLNLPEHQPMIMERYPQYAARVIYWDIPDIGEMPVKVACTLLQSHILDLISLLKTHSPGDIS